MQHRSLVKSYLAKKKPLVVGAIAEISALAAAPGGCEVVELRLDSLGVGPEVIRYAQQSPLPLLVTARGPAEGGQRAWTIAERAQAYQELMPYAALIDIELGDFDNLAEVVQEARRQGVVTVASFHDFAATPSLDDLARKLRGGEVDVHKFALMANTLEDIKTHLSLLETLPQHTLSVMGMGPLGAAARPLMAKAGSVLNYGYLGGTPTAPNQWPACLLSEAIAV